MASRRILVVSSLWPPAVRGGAEAHASALAGHLRARGHEVRALTFGVPGPDVVASVPAWPYRADAFASQSRARRLAFHALDVYRPATRRVMTEAIRTFRPDVVHSHVVAGLSGSALAVPSTMGVAHVHTLHDYWLLCQRSSLTRRDGTACDVRCVGCRVVTGMRRTLIHRHPPGVVIAVSQAIADEHRDVSWIAERVRVIANPTDPASPVDVPHGSGVVFGYVGRLTVEKGVRTLFAAFSAARLEGARLLVAGEGPLRAELEATATPGVEMLGWLDPSARERMLTTIDALVVPSEYKDPAPLVIGEARARRIPVIGARIGGIPELVPRASSALLFPSGGAAALAERLTMFARAPGTFVDDRDPGDLMNWDHHLDLLERAYDDAMPSSPR